MSNSIYRDLGEGRRKKKKFPRGEFRDEQFNQNFTFPCFTIYIPEKTMAWLKTLKKANHIRV